MTNTAKQTRRIGSRTFLDMIWDGSYRSQEVTATGRATCRGCGETLNKGEEALQFMYAWENGGSSIYQQTTCQIHKARCTPQA